MFRALWFATIASNIGTWMQNVGASWLMTTLSPSPLIIAMVQAATSLPVFLLALPAGALADIVDRRALILITQVWMLAAAAALSAATYAGAMSPALLLLLTFLLGIGSAMSGPAWQAMITDLVAPQEVSAAVALNSVAFNLARARRSRIRWHHSCARRSGDGFSAECNFLYRSICRSLSLEVGAKREHTPG